MMHGAKNTYQLTLAVHLVIPVIIIEIFKITLELR